MPFSHETHLCARDHLVLPSEDVNQLALALISPLCAQDHSHLCAYGRSIMHG